MNKPQTKRVSYDRQMQLWGILFILPATIVMLTFRVAPILMSLRLSFFDASMLRRTQEFIGLTNYITAFSDPQLLNSLKVTFLFLITKVPIQVVLALLLAILVNQAIFGIGIFRSFPLMATVMPLSIAAIIWKMMYHPSNGLINGVLRSVGMDPVRFLSDPLTALPSIVGMTIWKDVGFFMIIFLAGLQGIPEEYYEAAKVDGASALARFWHITLPLLRRTTSLVIILSTVNSFQVFVPVYVMTSGSPYGLTEVIIYYIYKIAFLFNRMGYAQTLAIITLVIIALLSIVQNRLTRSEMD